MRLLLDTHILLWALEDNERLPERARNLISNLSNHIVVSVAALWEIELKHAAHPHRMPCDAEQVSILCQQAGYQSLPISGRHVRALPTLRYDDNHPPHHDPFDRIMLCQAKVDGLALLTHDSLLPNYLEGCVLYV